MLSCDLVFYVQFQVKPEYVQEWKDAVVGVIDRGFCPIYGSRLFGKRAMGNRISITAASLDNPSWLRPAMDVYTLPDYKIRAARLEDLTMLAEIERAAATLFCDTPYPFLVDAAPLSLDFVARQFQAGRVWVAVGDRDQCVGYAIAQEVDGNAYLQQIDVHPAHGGRGIGRELVETVCRWAKQQNYPKILLSTFRDIEWNAPFYAKVGFQILAEDELTAGFQQIKRQEAEAGLPTEQRAIVCREFT